MFYHFLIGHGVVLFLWLVILRPYLYTPGKYDEIDDELDKWR